MKNPRTVNTLKVLTSADNPLVKSIRRLQKGAPRGEDDRIVLEGLKLVDEALSSEVQVLQALISTDLSRRARGGAILQRLEAAGVPTAAVNERLFRRCSNLESPEGVLLVARSPLRPATAIEAGLVPLIAGVQDPGNLGAIARVAEAVGASALMVCRGSSHPFHPKALRGSMGSLLRLPIVDGGEPEAAGALLKHKGFSIAGCVPRGGTDFRKAELGGSLAIALGSESSGLSRNLLEACDLRLSVPMKGPIDSLNVAVVAGLVLYEAARQRGAI